ncbi:MAG: PAS domain S-box protein [Promethearchaeota archaeon]
MVVKKKTPDIYENKYKFLIDNISDVLIELDTNGIVDYVNPHIYRELGYQPEEIIGRDLFEFICSDDIEKITKMIQKNTDSNGSIIDIRISNKDEKLIWFDIEAKRVKDNRSINKILITLKNITKFKNLEENLRKIEEKFRNIFTESFMTLALYDSNGKLIDANKACLELINVPNVNDIKGYDMFSDPNLLEDAKKKLQNGQLAKFELVYDYDKVKNTLKPGKSGKAYFEATITPIFNDKGEICYYLNQAQDITKRKQAEMKLKESEEKYRTLFESSKDGIIFTTIDGKILDANQVYLDMLGYTIGEVKELSYQQLTPKKWHKMEADIVKNQIIARGYSDEYEKEYIRKDNIIIPISIKVWILKNKQGKPIGMWGIVRDITERRLAEQKLKKSEEKYRALIENFQGIAFQGYQDFSASFLQGAVEEITGYTEEDFISGNIRWDQLIHPDDLPDIRKRVEIFHEDPNLINDKREYRIINKYGKIKWVLELIDYFYDHKKKMDGVRGIIVDITEKKITEKKLEESEQKYRDLIETSSMGLLEIDFVKGGVIYINPKLLDLIGYSREELNDENIFYKVIYPENIKNIREIDEEQDIEFRLLNKEGKTIWLSGIIRNQFDDRNNLLKSRLWVQDITEKKEMAEIKSNLLTRFSHEFKTPLISIKGFTDLLLTDYRESFNNKTLSFLKRIRDGAERLKILIDDFIESSQLDKNLVELTKTRGNISNLIKQGIVELEGIMNLRKHNINVDIPDELIMDVDKDKILSVISNILLNSIKYTPKGGNIAILSEVKKDSVIISIKDNGIGLKKREIEQLFQPFGKIERYGKGSDIISEGIGLGLYLSKEIIELHGGTIWVESEGRNKGCTFSFSLPFKKR